MTDSQAHPADGPTVAPRPDPPGHGIISERLAQQKKSDQLLIWVVRALFLVLLVTVTTLTIGAQFSKTYEFSTTTLISMIIVTVAVAIIVLGVDYLTPNKRLASVVGVYLGICVGLLGAIAIAKIIDVVAQAWGLTGQPRYEMRGDRQIEIIDPNPYLEMAKVIIGIVLCYLAVSFVLTTKDDFRFVIPYVEFSKQMRGVRPLVTDTSVLIDGRIEAMVESGFMDSPIVIPMFVVEELQQLSDSGDRLKRMRGRRGLDVVAQLRNNPEIDLSIEGFDVPGHSVDHKLVDLARLHDMRILTTDYNLVKVARINGASALNLNDLAAGLKTGILPGEALSVEIVKPGENEGQGVGFMADGTMIVVENAVDFIGETVEVTVTNALQTSAGKMIFARLSNGEVQQADDSTGAAAVRAQHSATSQPRTPVSGQARETRPSFSRRNPRRS